jgi:hypothetical protein
MAKTKEVKEKKVKKVKVIETYVVQMKMHTFTAPILDDNGEPIPMRDPVTNQHLRVNNRPLYLEETVKFVNIVDNVRKGCLCQYKVTSETPQAIADALAKFCATPNNPVITQDDWIKNHNPQQFAEIERRRKLEKEVEEAYLRGKAEGGDNIDLEVANDNLKDEVETKNTEISELEKKVAELEKGSKS